MDRKLGQKKQVKKQRWEPMVCTPAYDGMVTMEFAQAMAESSFCCPLFQVQLTASIIRGGCFVDLTRNIFVRMFLEDEKFKSCTHLFFIDSDLKWSPNAFVGLVRSDLPICAGVYPKRQTPMEFPIKFTEHPEEGGMWVKEIDGLDWIMADRVPTGFLCIRRDVVEEMAKDCETIDIHGQPGPVPYLFQTMLADTPDGIGTDEVLQTNPGNNEYTAPRWEGAKRYIGEDYVFCDKYRKKYGESIPVWPDIDFWHGGYEGNLLHHLEEHIEKEESLSEAG